MPQLLENERILIGRFGNLNQPSLHGGLPLLVSPPAFSASAILSERITCVVLLLDVRSARHQPEPRARGGACEGLKRTRSGSEPDSLPDVQRPILNKRLHSAGRPGPRLSGPSLWTTRKTAILSRGSEHCGRPKAGSVARLQAARQAHRFQLHFEQRQGTADRWME